MPSTGTPDNTVWGFGCMPWLYFKGEYKVLKHYEPLTYFDTRATLFKNVHRQFVWLHNRIQGYSHMRSIIILAALFTVASTDVWAANRCYTSGPMRGECPVKKETVHTSRKPQWVPSGDGEGCFLEPGTLTSLSQSRDGTSVSVRYKRSSEPLNKSIDKLGYPCDNHYPRIWMLKRDFERLRVRH